MLRDELPLADVGKTAPPSYGTVLGAAPVECFQHRPNFVFQTQLELLVESKWNGILNLKRNNKNYF